jgi:KUP system potassium uptake protein
VSLPNCNNFSDHNVLLELWKAEKYKYLAQRKLSIEGLNGLLARVNSRVPGICFFCSDLISGLPLIIENYVKNVGSLHEVLVIVTIRRVPVKTVLLSERFMVGKLEPKGVYKCIAQYALCLLWRRAGLLL